MVYFMDGVQNTAMPSIKMVYFMDGVQNTAMPSIKMVYFMDKNMDRDYGNTKEGG